MATCSKCGRTYCGFDDSDCPHCRKEKVLKEHKNNLIKRKSRKGKGWFKKLFG